LTLRAILFDFDFTLADSTAGAVECVNHALLASGFPAADWEAIRRSVAYPLPEVLARLTGVEDGAAAAAFAQAFITRADEVMAPLTALFAGVVPAVSELRDRGLKTGIVSTKFRYRIQAILANHDAGDLFDVIVGGEDVRQHKPHPECLQRALARLNLRPDQALYVGDHPVDGRAAEAAGVPFVFVRSGVAREDEFAGLPRLTTLGSVTELPAWIKQVTPTDKRSA
jgi:phosphoglycolate phosphatase